MLAKGQLDDPISPIRCHLEGLSGSERTRGRLAMDALAEATAGYSGAELAAVCSEAILQAIGRGLERGPAPQWLVFKRSLLAGSAR
jgi:SpoVK/Ycf46/Vps4 family AAA+-type ATPase